MVNISEKDYNTKKKAVMKTYLSHSSLETLMNWEKS